MSEVRLPVSAIKWLCGTLVAVLVLLGAAAGWAGFELGRSTHPEDPRVAFDPLDFARGQVSVEAADSAVVDVLGEAP